MSEGLPPLSDWLPLLRESLAHQGRFHWHVRGTSMLPTLPPDCTIEIAPTGSQVPLGSLVVFDEQGALVVHRLVHRSSGRWIAQGDGRWHPDPPLQPDQVLGVAVAAYCNAGPCWPSRFSSVTRWGWVARYHALRVMRRLHRMLRD